MTTYELHSEQLQIAQEIDVDLAVSSRKNKKICVKWQDQTFHLGDLRLSDYFHGATEAQRTNFIKRFGPRASQSVAINLVLMINWNCFDYIDFLENF